MINNCINCGKFELDKNRKMGDSLYKCDKCCDDLKAIENDLDFEKISMKIDKLLDTNQIMDDHYKYVNYFDALKIAENAFNKIK
jgi:hypothetical protein